MDDLVEPDQRRGDDRAGSQTSNSRRGRLLDARTVAIWVCVAAIGALASYLIASAVVGGDRSGDDGDLGSSGQAPQIKLSSAEVDGAKLLATELKTVEGQPATLNDVLADKPALVNLWQQSCAPCVKEMPLLERLGRSDDRIDVIGVDTQDRLDLAQEMARSTGITYRWLQDPSGDAFYAAQGVGLPTSVLIEPSGKVLAVRTGPFTSLADATSWLDDHLS